MQYRSRYHKNCICEKNAVRKKDHKLIFDLKLTENLPMIVNSFFRRTLYLSIFQSLLIKTELCPIMCGCILFVNLISFVSSNSNLADGRILSFCTLVREYTQSLCRCETSVMSNRAREKKMCRRTADEGSQPSDFGGKATPSRFDRISLYIPTRVSPPQIYLRYSRRFGYRMNVFGEIKKPEWNSVIFFYETKHATG